MSPTTYLWESMALLSWHHSCLTIHIVYHSIQNFTCNFHFDKFWHYSGRLKPLQRMDFCVAMARWKPCDCDVTAVFTNHNKYFPREWLVDFGLDLAWVLQILATSEQDPVSSQMLSRLDLIGNLLVRITHLSWPPMGNLGIVHLITSIYSDTMP